MSASTQAAALLPVHLVVMGVAGCGKSAFGERLARQLNLPLIEGDAFHPSANVQKMQQGVPLTDEDRQGWLHSLADQLASHPGGAVLTCSALKASYRTALRAGVPVLRFVHLAITPAESLRRVAQRADHFYPPSLVASQFEALQDPRQEPHVIELDGTLSLATLTQLTQAWLAPTEPFSNPKQKIMNTTTRQASPAKAFASQADLAAKKITFEQLSPHCWAYTAEGDPNSGVIIGDNCIIVSDATATPAMAQDLIAKIRTVSNKPIKYVLLTHYHAVRVLGASAYVAEGATEIIASRGTLELIRERGAQDMQSEIERFPRLFQGAESIPGLTWPSMVVGNGQPGRQGSLSINLGGVVVEIWHPGPGHTRGDTIAWVEEEKVLFSGDLVEYEAGVYTGDAQLQEWPATLEALRALKAESIVPGRGEAMQGAANVNKALDYTQRWVTTLFNAGKEAAAQNMNLKAAMAHTRTSMDPVFGHVFIYEHCLPFDVSRAYDEAKGIKNPRIWTAERDKEMWAALQG